MNLNRYKTVHFFECGNKNVIFNLGITAFTFLLFPKTPGTILIPLLFLFNTLWIIAYTTFNYLQNNQALVISGRGISLLVQLIIFFLLSCFFWFPYSNRKFFIISNTLINVIVLLLHLFGKPLKNRVVRFFYKINAVVSNSRIISKLKLYLGNTFYRTYYCPSVTFLHGKRINGKRYNQNISMPKMSKVYINGEVDLQDTLDKAEYTFGNIHLGDTIANWVISNPSKHEYEKTISARKLTNRALKRGFDIVVSLLIIIFFLSWMAPLIGLLIKIESRGPVFFKQLRSGRNNRPFWCYKFRSMHINEKSDELQATKGDRRITILGAFLRKTSIDEFPQFLNVLKGEMSIVGPRPHMLKHTELYGEIIDNYMRRLMLKQGLTGWAQVKGYRGETSEIKFMENRVRHDLWYMNNWSFWLDIKIVFLTAIKIFKAQDAVF